MPYLKDNLDELLQNAARDYPLKTSTSNWEAVAKKLNTPVKTKISAKRLLLPALFLLIAAGGIVLKKSQSIHSPTRQEKNLKPVAYTNFFYNRFS